MSPHSKSQHSSVEDGGRGYMHLLLNPNTVLSEFLTVRSPVSLVLICLLYSKFAYIIRIFFLIWREVFVFWTWALGHAWPLNHIYSFQQNCLKRAVLMRNLDQALSHQGQTPSSFWSANSNQLNSHPWDCFFWILSIPLFCSIWGFSLFGHRWHFNCPWLFCFESCLICWSSCATWFAPFFMRILRIIFPPVKYLTLRKSPRNLFAWRGGGKWSMINWTNNL